MYIYKNVYMTVHMWEHTWHLGRCVQPILCFARVCVNSCMFDVRAHQIYLTLLLQLCTTTWIHLWAYSFVQFIAFTGSWCIYVIYVCAVVFYVSSSCAESEHAHWNMLSSPTVALHHYMKYLYEVLLKLLSLQQLHHSVYMMCCSDCTVMTVPRKVMPPLIEENMLRSSLDLFYKPYCVLMWQ